MNDELVAPGFGAVADAFRRTIAQDGRSGAALSVWIEGRPVVRMQGGVADVRTGRGFDASTLSVVFSCTKGLASVLVAILIERGMLPGYDTPVVEVWPEFGAHGKGRVTIGDLLAHRAGVSAPRQELSSEERFDDLRVADALAEQEPLWSPGEQHQYHTVVHGALTAKLVHLATGRRIGDVFAAEIAAPLGAEAWIGLPEGEERRVAHLVAEPVPAPDFPVSPESAHWLQRAAEVNGPIAPEAYNDPRLHRAGLAGAGGVATADALARIWSATVTETAGVRLLRDGTVEELRRLRSSGPPRFVAAPPPYQAWGAGVMVPSDSEKYLSARSFGHDGAGGQSGFADPDAKVGVGYVTNLMRDPERANSVIRALARALG